MASPSRQRGAAITVIQGSIVEQKVDVIVNSTRTELYLETAGSLSKAISEAAGPSLQAECRKEYPDGFALDDVAVTAGHALPCQNIYHVGLLPWDGGNGDSVKHLAKTIERCWTKAISEAKSSIAFPALASKGHEYPVDVVAKITFETLRALKLKSYGKKLSKVLVVIHPNDEDIYKVYKSVFHPKTTTKICSAHINGTTIRICSGSIADHKADVVVNTTSVSLRPLGAGRYCKAIFDTAGPKLKEQCEQLYPNGIKEEELAITGGHRLGCKAIYHIYCPAWDPGTSLKKLQETVFKCLQQACDDSRDSIVFPAIGTGGGGYPVQQVAATMLNSVQMFFKEKTRQKPKLVDILLLDQNKDWIKVFGEVFANQEPNAIETRIVLPKTWSKTSKDFERYEVTKSSAEFKDVEAKFLASSPERCDAAKSIFRLENKLLFQKYAMHRQSVEARCGRTDPERMLYHGTSVDAIDKINRGGFNRSYCGKNATVLGNGVYFAKNSAYSAQARYSVPDTDGTRYMYYARVLVGQHAKGKSGLRVPPPLDSDPNVAHDSLVDSVSNPGIFVIFHDDQAYPEYLISF